MDVAVYNVALSTAEAIRYQLGERPLSIRPEKLVAYYPLGGRYGQNDKDWGPFGNRYPLTPYNTPTWAPDPPTITPQPPRQKFWQVRQTPVYNTYISQQVAVTPGSKLNLSAYTRGDGTNAGRVAVYDVTNSAYILPITSTGRTSTSYTWYLAGDITIPANCSTIEVRLYAPAASAGYAYFDDVSLSSSTSGELYKIWLFRARQSIGVGVM
jgi:hypothetical protein